MKKVLSVVLVIIILTLTFAMTACNFVQITASTQAMPTESTTSKRLPDGQNPNEDVDVTYNEAYDGSSVEITFWHSIADSSGRFLASTIARFNEIYPNIHVNDVVYGDYESLYNKISITFNADKQPNLAFCFPDYIALLSEAESVIALDDLINNTSVIGGSSEMMGFSQAQLDDFVEEFYNEGRGYGDGKMYSLPLPKSTDLLYYNKTVFDALGLEAPTTWEEMEEVIQVLKAEYPDSIPLGYDSSENFFITLSAQYNAPYTSATGEHYLFVNDTSKAFVEKFAEWYYMGWMTTSELMGGYYTSDAFKKDNDELGKMFMSIASSTGARYQRPDKVSGEYPFEVGIASVPQVNPDAPKAISQGPSICIFKNNNPQEVYASWLFIKFLLTDIEFQAEYCIRYGYSPITQSVCNSTLYSEYLDKADGGDFITSLAAKVAVEQRDYYFTPPAFVGSNNARTQVGDLLDSVLSRYKLGEDNSAMIDEQFKKYYDICKNGSYGY